jgi:hypothetical protein
MSQEEKRGIPADGSLALSHRARAFQKFAHAGLSQGWPRAAASGKKSGAEASRAQGTGS